MNAAKSAKSVGGLSFNVCHPASKVPPIVSFWDEYSALLSMASLFGKDATILRMRDHLYFKGIPWLIGNDYFQHQVKYCQCL